MALTNCKECKQEVSTEAKTCPHCGIHNPGIIDNNSRRVGIVVLVVLIFLFLYLFTRHEKVNYQYAENTGISDAKQAEVIKAHQEDKAAQVSSGPIKPIEAPTGKPSTPPQQPSEQAPPRPPVTPAQSKQEAPKPDKSKTISSVDTPQILVMRLLEYALDNGGLSRETEIQQTKLQIESLPKPAEGNKKAARMLNAKGLAASKKGDFKMAVKMLEEANNLDKADIEIVNNLGFSYLKQGNLDSAQQTIILALTLSPDRAAAWENLGELFGVKGDISKAIACFSNAYRFSKERSKMHHYMKTLNGQEKVKNLKNARAKAITWAEKSYPNISKNTKQTAIAAGVSP